MYADTFSNGWCSNQRVNTQMQRPNLCGPLLVNESNYNAALLRACLCTGCLGIEFRAFIASGYCDASLDTRATLIGLASFTYWLPSDGSLRWTAGLGGSSGLVAMASKL